MNYQYPLEALARRRGSAAQREFAQQARHALFDSDDAIYEAHDHGLVILAASEDALQLPESVLREIYGSQVEIRPPRVRHMPGDPPQVPMAHARISTRHEFSLKVMAELRRRGARILEECSKPRLFIVRAEAPFEDLLGLPARLQAITRGDAVHAIRLLGYAPWRPDPIAA